MKIKILPVTLFTFFGILFFFIIKNSIDYSETKLLPYYILRTLLRLTITYFLCLAFGLFVGIWASTNDRIGNIVIPLLDILQSVPVLGFFPFVLIFIINAMNQSILGLELASIFLLFTSMAWSIVFGVIAGVKSIPQNIKDMSRIFHIRGWDYIRHIILPSIYPPLIAGSILAWGSGWYFLIATEFITFGDKVYSLPGLGYYLHIASYKYANLWMSLMGLISIALVVWLINRFVWYRINQNARQYKFLALQYGFKKPAIEKDIKTRRQHKYIKHKLDAVQGIHLPSWFFRIFRFSGRFYLIAIAIIVFAAGFLFSSFKFPIISIDVLQLAENTGYSIARIFIAYMISLALAIIFGFIIIKKPNLRSVFLPAADIMQSIPALAYFPLLLLIFTDYLPGQIGLEIASILLLITGMLWYLIFNVIEAIEHFPREINEVAGIFSIKGAMYIKHILAPALFPAIITGSILAWGGGWNATIVSEYINMGEHIYKISGLGSALDIASVEGDIPLMLVILILMTGIIIILNHFVWRKLLDKANMYVLEE